jgi:hypothetical protein
MRLLWAYGLMATFYMYRCCLVLSKPLVHGGNLSGYWSTTRKSARGLAEF